MIGFPLPCMRLLPQAALQASTIQSFSVTDSACVQATVKQEATGYMFVADNGITGEVDTAEVKKQHLRHVPDQEGSRHAALDSPLLTKGTRCSVWQASHSHASL